MSKTPWSFCTDDLYLQTYQAKIKRRPFEDFNLKQRNRAIWNKPSAVWPGWTMHVVVDRGGRLTLGLAQVHKGRPGLRHATHVRTRTLTLLNSRREPNINSKTDLGEACRRRVGLRGGQEEPFFLNNKYSIDSFCLNFFYLWYYRFILLCQRQCHFT